MQKYLAELVGTAALVFIGCGAVAIGGLGGALGAGDPVSPVALLPIALAFGLAVTGMAYAIGPVSGCHINPAVSVAMFVAGRLSVSDLVGYVIAQVAGAIVGAALVYAILASRVNGVDLAVTGLGQTTYNPAQYSYVGAFLAEAIGTFFFLVVILGSTQSKSVTPAAGLAIGLTLAILHLAIVPVTGNSLNPARTLGPALFLGGDALKQAFTLYIAAPIVGAVVAALFFRAKLIAAE